MYNLWKCVMYFLIISLINVVFSSKITIHVDDEGKVTSAEPTHEWIAEKWTVVEKGNTLVGQIVGQKYVAGPGELATIQKWLNMKDVEFEHLSNTEVMNDAESAKLDIWANGMKHHSTFLTQEVHGSIDHLKKAVESHVTNHLVAKVFDGQKPKKVKFGVAYKDYVIQFEEDFAIIGINFRIILKKD